MHLVFVAWWQVANGGGVAELAIRVTAAVGHAEHADRATVVTLHDRISLQNSSGIPLEWRQKGTHDATHDLPANDEIVSLHWDDADASRFLHVRPKDGAHEWCAPFSPERLGEMTLKLRQNSSADDDAEVLYLRCSVAMQGCRRHLVLKTSIGLSLPYNVVNDSAMLLAFKQPGSAHWDLLGSGESCSYVLDAPDESHSLRLYARDPAARWQVLLGEPFKLDRIGQKACMHHKHTR